MFTALPDEVALHARARCSSTGACTSSPTSPSGARRERGSCGSTGPPARARGLCHEVLPEIVELDEWGYPIVTGPVTEELRADAETAVSTCPRLALRLVKQ